MTLFIPKFPSYRNSEFMQFVKNVLEVLSGYDTVALNLKAQADALQATSQQLDELFKKRVGSELTKLIEQYDDRRDKDLIGLRTTFEGMAMHANETKATAAQALLVSMDKYGKRIYQMGYMDETNIIDNLMQDWETNPELIGALNQLGLTDWATMLKATNIEFIKVYRERVDEQAALPKERIVEARDEAVASYRNLAKFIEANALLNPNPLYGEIINKLNVYVDSMNQTVEKRIKGGDTNEEDMTGQVND